MIDLQWTRYKNPALITTSRMMIELVILTLSSTTQLRPMIDREMVTLSFTVTSSPMIVSGDIFF
jgi:hypothetical protein